jgi:6-phosphogluconate dehydrogenase
MQLAMIGLGRMGAGLCTRLLAGGHGVVGFDAFTPTPRSLLDQGLRSAKDLAELVEALPTPRVLWLMVPAGAAVDGLIQELQPLLTRGDVLVDGGNSNYRSSQERAIALAEHGVAFLDVGTSGGIWGPEGGYCLMVGGEERAVGLLRPALETLAPTPELGWAHVGPSGAGHFVKMVHNGIEYGLMQAYAEGFALLQKKSEFGLDPAQIAELWGQGSVVRSWLLELAARALRFDPGLAGIVPYVQDSGMGRWTVEEALALGVPMPAAAAALFERFSSREPDSFAHRLLAALRGEFGGHALRARAQPEGGAT